MVYMGSGRYKGEVGDWGGGEVCGIFGRVRERENIWWSLDLYDWGW